MGIVSSSHLGIPSPLRRSVSELTGNAYLGVEEGLLAVGLVFPIMITAPFCGIRLLPHPILTIVGLLAMCSVAWVAIAVAIWSVFSL